MDDPAEWKGLRQAFVVVGFDSDEEFAIYKLLACILHFGNVTFTGMLLFSAEGWFIINLVCLSIVLCALILPLFL